ncbi:MAG: PD40 domain-containing protein [Armatimonadetes bacterium]|nr:PD40 domain-containing protein [Armatimonadota bacterium]
MRRVLLLGLVARLAAAAGPDPLVVSRAFLADPLCPRGVAWRLKAEDSFEPGKAKLRGSAADSPLTAELTIDREQGRVTEASFGGWPPWEEPAECLPTSELVARGTAFAQRWLRPDAEAELTLSSAELEPNDATLGLVYQLERPVSRLNCGLARVAFPRAGGRLTFWMDDTERVPATVPSQPMAELTARARAEAAALLKAEPRSLRTLLADSYYDAFPRNGAKVRSARACFHFGVDTEVSVDTKTVRMAVVSLDSATGERLAHTGVADAPRWFMLLLTHTPEQYVALVQRYSDGPRDRWPVWSSDSQRLWWRSNRRHLGGSPARRCNAVVEGTVEQGLRGWWEPGWSEQQMAAPLGRASLAVLGNGRYLLDGLASVRDYQSGQQTRLGDSGYGTDLDGLGDQVVAMGGVSDPGSWLSRWRLDPASATVVANGRLTGLPDNARLPLLVGQGRQVAMLDAKGWTDVTRLSRVGDEPRILVSAGDGLWLVDLADGRRAALPGQPFDDPDTGERLLALEAVVSPNGQLIAFCAKTRGDELTSDYHCLYLVGRDGTGLRRLTPRADPLVEPLALELAQRWWREATAKP